MRILFLGDIMGRSGRDAVAEHLPDLKDKLKPDVIIVNGENAANGKGITSKICKQLYELGVDCITTGNHIWDNREIITYIDGDKRLIRPMNYPKGTPGQGEYIHTLADGRNILIINMMGNLFMGKALDDPFNMMIEKKKEYALKRNVDAIFVDFHAETTSEKMSMGHHLDGWASVVVGTHTHIPTADAHILSGGTAYQTDIGMCGDYDSVIGVNKEAPLANFIRKMPGERFTPAAGEATICGTFIIVDDNTGLSKSIQPIRVGGILSSELPAY